MKLDLSALTIDDFLENYWQKKPVIIKNGIINFNNPCDANELAGLAAEANIESRLIFQDNDKKWQAESGPFDTYEQYGETGWTLVVQSVNHWLPEVQAFARLFDFIPQWRFDDVMVSFATEKGGVGPHVDNYDVFICQGSGQRHWRIGSNANIKEKISHQKLLHVEPFEAMIDETVSAGDIVYIPPGFPHEGTSIDESMSFSVGYKSTNATELLSGLADYFIDYEKSPALLSDSERGRCCYGSIDNNDFNRLKNFLKSTLSNDTQLADFIGIHYSQSLSELDLACDDYSFNEWLALFNTQPLHKLHAVKMLYLEQNVDKGIFYLDGETQQLSVTPDIIQLLCNEQSVEIGTIQNHNDKDVILSWLYQQTNRGYWYFE